MPIQSTPINRRWGSMHAASLLGAPGAHHVSQYRLRLAQDMTRESVLLDIGDFCDHLLPQPDDPRFADAGPQPDCGNPPLPLKKAASMSEKDISIELLKAINLLQLVPGCKAAHCESRPDLSTIDRDGQKVDAALFDEAVDVSDGRPKWADQGVPIEFKQELDPFDDKKKDANADAPTRTKVRGQVSHYAELIIGVQQRLFLFMILIVGRKFRILRWDRSGLVVSTAVDYYTDWKLFCDILWRISLAHRFAPEMLGADPTAVRLHPNDKEWEFMTTAAKPHADDVGHTERVLEDDELTKPFVFGYVRQAFRETLVNKYPRYKVEVPGKDKTRYFLVCRPFFQAKGLAGRGTRGYVALEYDPTPSTPGERRVHHFVFLKDAWRMNYDGVSSEGGVLAELNNADVQYVPTLVCHGDIGDPVQETETPHCWHMKNPPPAAPAPSHSDSDAPPCDELSSSTSGNLKRKRPDDMAGSSDGASADPGNEGSDGDDEDPFATGCPMRSHVHYRFVVEEVARPLSTSESGLGMLVAVIDCVKAHQGAYKLNILHRDISAGNILIYPRVEIIDGQRVLRWVGLLTDWELSKKIDEPPTRRQLERTGTWQFMSYGLLTNGSKVVELCDDLESFFYVILYFAIRYLDSNCPDVAAYIEDFFDCYTVLNGVYYVGATKKHAIKHADLDITQEDGNRKLTFSAEAMDSMIFELLRSFAAHYKVRSYDETQNAILPALPVPPPQAVAPKNNKPFNPYRLGSKIRAAAQKKRADDPTVPTKEERVRAKNVMDHDLFLEVLEEAACSDAWTMEWKDRISATWVSLRKLGPPATGNRSKKQKTESWCPALFQATSEPPRTPSRTSSSKRGSKQSGRGGRGQKGGAPSQRRAPAENQHQMALRQRKP